MSAEAANRASRRRGPAWVRVRPRRRTSGGARGWAFLFASCLGSELALADTSIAGAVLSAARSEPAASPAAPPEPSAQHRLDRLELRVSYRAPHDCPSSGDFLDALQRHLVAGGSGGIDADVSITRAGAAQFELALRLRVAGHISDSTVRAASCAALMQLAALNASMARTATSPEAMASAAPSFAIEPGSRLERTAPPAASSELTDAPEPDAGTARRQHRSGSNPRGFVLGEVRSASGILPQLAWGRGLALGVAREALSLRLSGTIWQDQRGSFAPDGSSPMHLDFEQRSLGLAPCAGVELSSRLRLDGCALLAAHRVATSAEHARAYASFGAAALATLSPWRGLRVELEGGIAAAVRRPSFSGDRWEGLYEPARIQPSARLALGWEFGGGT